LQLNLTECWFAELSHKRIRRETFNSVAELTAVIQEHIERNKTPPPNRRMARLS